MTTDRLVVPKDVLHHSPGASALHDSPRTSSNGDEVREAAQRRYNADFQDIINDAHHNAEAVEDSVARLKEGLDGFRNLLNKYQRTRNQWEHQAQLTQRATENWIPSISDDIDQSQAIAEEVLAKIPPLEGRLQAQLEEYRRGIEQAAYTQTQLEWHAGHWTTKLKKILLGEVKEKRIKFLRVVAPFLLGGLVLLIVGAIGRLSLRWALLYYRSLRRNLKA